MNDHNLGLFAASLAALAAGPLVYGAARGLRPLAFLLHALFAATVVTLSAVLVLPELVREMGIATLPMAALGALTPTLAERALQRSPRGGHALSMWVALLALSLHAFCDGLAVHGLHTGHAETHAEALALGAVLHRLPEGAAVWWLVRGRLRGVVITVFAGLALSSAAGFVFASRLTATGALSGWLEAFVAGVVLHVVFHHWPARAGAREAAHAHV